MYNKLKEVILMGLLQEADDGTKTTVTNNPTTIAEALALAYTLANRALLNDIAEGGEGSGVLDLKEGAFIPKKNLPITTEDA